MFAAPAQEPDPQKRSLLVLRLVLIALRSQLYIGGSPKVSIKKPLNAFLGELFLASWTHAETDTTTKLYAEQVSHHPPITAMHIADEENGIRADGYARVEMTFSNCVNVKQIGHAILHIDKYDEDHLIPLPDVKVRGYLSACLYPEAAGTYSIVSSSGYVSEITFSGSGYFRGKKNWFTARTYNQHDPAKKSIYEVEGVWSEGWTVRDANGNVLEVFNFNDSRNEPSNINIPATEDQDPWESRRAWKPVIDGLVKGDYSRLSHEKHKLEEAQRRMRAQEVAEGKTWTPLLFTSIPGEDHDVFHRLAKGTEWELRDGDTKGVWRIDDKAKFGNRPSRGALTPLG